MNREIVQCTHTHTGTIGIINGQNGLILKGTRIVIPKKMKMNIFERLHTGHLGQEKCKRRTISTVFWPDINKDIEKMVIQCIDCLDQRAQSQ